MGLWNMAAGLKTLVGLAFLGSIALLYSDDMNTSSALREFCHFVTTGIVLSAFALSIVLARAGVINWGACMLVLTGNVVMFLTIFGFFVAFGNDDGFDYSSWGAY